MATLNPRTKKIISILGMSIGCLAVAALTILALRLLMPQDAPSTDTASETSKETIVTQAPPTPEAPEDTLLQEADQAIARNDMKTAIAKLETARESNNPAAIVKLARAYITVGRVDEAGELLRLASAIYSSANQSDKKAEVDGLLAGLKQPGADEPQNSTTVAPAAPPAPPAP